MGLLTRQTLRQPARYTHIVFFVIFPIFPFFLFSFFLARENIIIFDILSRFRSIESEIKILFILRESENIIRNAQASGESIYKMWKVEIFRHYLNKCGSEFAKCTRIFAPFAGPTMAVRPAALSGESPKGWKVNNPRFENRDCSIISHHEDPFFQTRKFPVLSLYVYWNNRFNLSYLRFCVCSFLSRFSPRIFNLRDLCSLAKLWTEAAKDVETKNDRGVVSFSRIERLIHW